jgi:putative membrane protein
MNFILRWLVTTLALSIVAYLLPGVRLADFPTALVAGLVVTVLNRVLRPFLMVITLPITVMTLGISTLVINGLLLLLAARFVSGFTVTGFWQAFWGALLLSIVTLILNMFTVGTRDMRFAIHRTPPQPRRQRGQVIEAEVVPEKKEPTGRSSDQLSGGRHA